MVWRLLKGTFSGFIADGALSQGAAIAYYTIFSIAPVLVIAISIAGLAFGQDAARGAIVGQLGGLMGAQTADALQTMIRSASDHKSGVIETILGVGALLVAASGVFGQMQTALNQIWKVTPQQKGMSRVVRARIVSLGLVMALGILLMASLVISAVLSALGHFLDGLLPGGHILMTAAETIISLALIAVLFGAIYKVLPDRTIGWRDVTVGAIVTAVLFTAGKTLIGLYLGHTNIASSYGGASAFVLILLWIYYSSQIFLLGAEFTRVYAEMRGSQAPAAETAVIAQPDRGPAAAVAPIRPTIVSLPPVAAPVRMTGGKISWPSRQTLALDGLGVALTTAGLTLAFRAANRDRRRDGLPETSRQSS